jgi:hypothetical protein
VSDHDYYVRLGMVVWLGSLLGYHLLIRLVDWLRGTP